MSQLAQTADVELVVASQEAATLEFCRPYADQLIQLTMPNAAPKLPLDAHTAVACLFHEHEWEAPLLLDALRSPAFYVGALGSRQTQQRRVETLERTRRRPGRHCAPQGPDRPVPITGSTLARCLGAGRDRESADGSRQG